MSFDAVKDVLYGLAPTAGVAGIFILVIRALLRADAGERAAAEEFRAGPDPAVTGDGKDRPDGAPGAEDS